MKPKTPQANETALQCDPGRNEKFWRRLDQFARAWGLACAALIAAVVIRALTLG